MDAFFKIPVGWIAWILLGLLFFCFWFFRDPERIPPDDPTLAVSPADGTVTLVDEVEEEQFFKRRMKRVSIFLSVFDVHVNRTPISGQILFTEGRGGLYLDARKPEASLLNESLLWILGSRARSIGPSASSRSPGRSPAGLFLGQRSVRPWLVETVLE